MNAITRVTALFLPFLVGCVAQDGTTQELLPDPKPDPEVPAEHDVPHEEPAPTPDPTSGVRAHDCDVDGGYQLDSRVAAGGLGIVGIYEARNDDAPWWAEPACMDRLNECSQSSDPVSCDIDSVCDREPSVHPGTVRVERGGPRTLVLASYEPTNWTITVAEGASLERVILSGYYPNTAEVPAGVEVLTADLGFVYDWVDDGEGVDFDCTGLPADTCEIVTAHYQSELARNREALLALIAGAEQLSGETFGSFHGCYSMSSITLGAIDE